MKNKIVFFWFRRDLRLHDNHGLFAALNSGYPVVPVFIFDKIILDDLEDHRDRRVSLIHDLLIQLQQALRKNSSDILVLYGTPQNVWEKLLTEYNVAAIYTNEDYEPYTIQRDKAIDSLARSKGAQFIAFKDQVVFGPDEVLKEDGKPYTIYTPYKNKWRSFFSSEAVQSFPSELCMDRFYQFRGSDIMLLTDIGFEKISYEKLMIEPDVSILENYTGNRDFPALQGTGRMSVALRFGATSARHLAALGNRYSTKWLDELVWREFYMQILKHFPHVIQHAFRPSYDNIRWRNNDTEFEAWCNGQTGYPIVDAGMRELNQTGFMHNRVRMITASFLTKHLLIDWRWGEAYFAKKLLDYELASNNGNWQWAAGCGVDAAPYFRIFNPALQTKKFDPDLQYVRKWVPEIDTLSYPNPIVEHEFARQRCLNAYAIALKQQ